MPIRQLTAPGAVSANAVDAVVNVRVLSDGRVLATPLLGERVLLFDRMLQGSVAIADTLAFIRGFRAAQFVTIALPGDSTLLGDPNSGTLVVLDADGRRIRTVAPPRAIDAGLLAGGPASRPTLDSLGRLVYRGVFRWVLPSFDPDKLSIPPLPDSFPIVRAEFDTRTVDTLAVIHMPPGTEVVMSWTSKRLLSQKLIVQPLPTTDDWAVLSDGTVVIVRGQDYHVDWVRLDGSRGRGPKLPFAWVRIPDDTKRAIVDSMKAFVALADSEARKKTDSTGARRSTAQREVVPPNGIPDYYPPIKPGGVMPDRSDHLWVLPSTATSLAEGLLYDVIDRKGELVERVRLPHGCSLAGFGTGATVFVNCADERGRFHLQRREVMR